MNVLSSSPPAHLDFRFRLRSGPELDPFPAEEEPRPRLGGGAGESKDIGGAEKASWSGNGEYDFQNPPLSVKYTERL